MDISDAIDFSYSTQVMWKIESLSIRNSFEKFIGFQNFESSM